jgi:hypothetical protein
LLVITTWRGCDPRSDIREADIAEVAGVWGGQKIKSSHLLDNNKRKKKKRPGLLPALFVRDDSFGLGVD